MDSGTQLKVQAWLDGELPQAEAREVAARLERDRDSAALADELRNTRQALAGFEADVRLPESREFFWSKVEREINRQESRAAEPAPRMSYFALLRRLLVPVSTAAFVVVVGLVLIRPAAPISRSGGATFETALADGGAFTYRDYAAGTTLVWLTFPADNDVADGDGSATLD
ncbi:MAG TPA: hypothetical protein P5205_01000 [Candidatus Paceibacterota bacterium]|nr:hypothetical protein [Verrucomicrobiota bacterium]HSA08928.1 hypothetical protein [Candidatus Paceibacterota bacterium]